jgi:hypothetical protein
MSMKKLWREIALHVVWWLAETFDVQLANTWMLNHE